MFGFQDLFFTIKENFQFVISLHVICAASSQFHCKKKVEYRQRGREAWQASERAPKKRKREHGNTNIDEKKLCNCAKIHTRMLCAAKCVVYHQCSVEKPV